MISKAHGEKSREKRAYGDPAVVAAQRKLFGFIRRGIKYELSKMEALLERLGHPERRCRWIHVAGTNGKGSVCAAVESILLAAGLRCGLTTSPHLVTVLERYRLDGSDVTGPAFVEAVDAAVAAAESMEADGEPCPTFFELAVAVAFHLFAQAGLDWAVAEVGLGGRLDATNVLRPAISVITNISRDHPKTLGDTLEAICREKCGIIKEGTPVVTGIEQPELLALTRAIAGERHAPLEIFDEGCSVSHIRMDANEGTRFDLTTPSGTLKDLVFPLLGAHQARNAAIAVRAVLGCPGLDVDEEAIRRGLAATRWPGRFEILRQGPILVADGGHNPAGAQVLVETFQQVFPGRKAICLCGFSGDKAVRTMLDLYAPIVDRIVFTRSSNYRAAEAAELCDRARREGVDLPMEAIEDPAPALERAIELAGESGIVLATGSLYLLGDFLAHLKGVPAQPITDG